MDYAAAEDVVFCLEKTLLVYIEVGQFDWKERTYRRLELPPIPLDDAGRWILGIMSCGDAEEGSECCAPYKVVCARQGFDTHVFDWMADEAMSAGAPDARGDADEHRVRRLPRTRVHHDGTQAGDFRVRFRQSQLELSDESVQMGVHATPTLSSGHAGGVEWASF